MNVEEFWAEQEATVSALPRWRDYAECAGLDPDLFFPNRGGDYRPAVRVCMSCPVRAECLSADLIDCRDLHTEPLGVRGGMGARVRKRLLGGMRFVEVRRYRVVR